MSEEIYPTCLEEAELLLEREKPKQAAVIVRNCLEGLLKNIVKIKKLPIFLERIKFSALNRSLYDQGLYDFHCFGEIRYLVNNIGNPAVHNEGDISHEEARRFISRIKDFIEDIYIPIIEDEKGVIIKKADFEIINKYLSNKEVKEKGKIHSISTGEEVEYTESRVKYKTKQKQKLQENSIKWWSESEKLNLIRAEPGQGKSSLLKALFNIASTNFQKNKTILIPIFVKLSNFVSFDHGFTLLREATENLLPESFLRKNFNEGRLLVLADGWDELEPRLRIDIERFLSRFVAAENSLTITSRFIESVPTLSNIIDQKKVTYEFQESELIPLSYHQIPQFIKNRNPSITDEKITILQHHFWSSGLKAIPLWLDLLSTIPAISPNNNLLEMDLLIHWINQVELRSTSVYESLSKIEELAYETIKPISPVKITRNYLKTFANLSDELISELITIGWLVYAGYDKVELKYEFVHAKLHEFLASRYIANKWNVLSGDIFDYHEGILSQSGKEEIIEYAILNQQYNNYDITTIAENIYFIAGDQDWEDDEKSYELLRDPFLAGYLFEKLELDQDSFPWINQLDSFYNKLFELLNEQEEQKRIILHHINQWYLIRAFLCRIPYVVLFDDNYGKFIKSTIKRVQLPINIIDKLLTILNDEAFLEKEEFHILFYELLSSRPTLGHWQDFLIEYAQSRVQTNDHAFRRFFSLLDQPIRNSLLLEWALNEDVTIKSYPCLQSNSWMYNTDKPKIIEIFEFWITEESEEFRNGFLKLLEEYPEYVNDYIADQLLLITTEEERSGLLRRMFYKKSKISSKNLISLYLSLSLQSQKQFLHQEHFLKLVATNKDSQLNSLFFNNAPLWIIIRFLKEYYTEEEIQEVLPKINIPENQVEIKESFDNFLFSSDKIYIIVKTLFKDYPEIIEYFLLEHQIYHQILKGEVNINQNDLLKALEKDENYLIHLKEELLKNNQLNVEESLFKIFDSFESPPKNLITTLLSSSPFKWTWICDKIIWKWFDDILTIDDTEILRKFSYFLRSNKNYISQTIEFQQKLFHLIESLKDKDLTWFYITCSVLVEVFTDKVITFQALNLLSQHTDSLIRATGYRILIENLGGNITNILNRAATSLRSDSIRPIIKEGDTIELDKKRVIGITEIDRNLDIKHDKLIFGLINARDFNFRTYSHPFSYNELMLPIRSKSFLALNINNTKKYNNLFRNWSFLKEQNTVSLDNAELKLILKALKDSDERITLAMLFYLEELLFRGFNFDENLQEIISLLHKSTNPLISGITVYLSLLSSTTEKKIELIKQLEPSTINLHAIFWAIGNKTNKEVEAEIFHLIKNFEKELLLKSFDVFTPWLMNYPSIYEYLWNFCLSLDENEFSSSLFFGDNVPTLFYYFMQRIITYHHNLKPLFLTDSELLRYDVIDNWFEQISTQLTIPRRVLPELLSKMLTFPDPTVQLFSKYVRIGLKIDTTLLTNMLETDNPSYTDIRFLLIFQKHLNTNQKEILYEILFNNDYDDLKYQAIEIIRSYEIDLSILPLLLLLLDWVEKNIEGNFLRLHLDSNAYSFFHQCGAILLKEDFEEVLSKLGNKTTHLITKRIDRQILYDILSFVNNKDEYSRVYSVVRNTLFSKIWFTFTNFWDYFLKKS